MQRKDGSIGFNLGRFDRTEPLVIDPLVYGSYYGGEGGDDEVRSVVADQDGGVYLVGSTQAFKFPALQGPYSFNLNGVQDAFVAKLRGDAYSNVYATFVGGSQTERAEFAQLDPFGNLWVAGTTQSVDFPGNTRANVQYLRLDLPPVDPTMYPNAGTFLLYHFNPNTGTYDISSQLPYSATAAQVRAALEAMPSLSGLVLSTTDVQGGLPRGEVRIQLDPSILDNVGVISNYEDFTENGDRPGGNPFDPTANNDQRPGIPDVNVGMEARYLVRNTGFGFNTVIHRGTTVMHTPGSGSRVPAQYAGFQVPAAPQETFTITFWNSPAAGAPPIESSTSAIPWNATAAQVQTALGTLTNLNGGQFKCTSGQANQSGSLVITFTPAGSQVPIALPDDVLYAHYTEQTLFPRPTYTSRKDKDIFVMRWARTADGLLDPLPTQALIFGSNKADTLAGFSVLRNDNPGPNDPVVIGFAGNTDGTLPEATAGTPTGAYLARYTYTPAGGFQKVGVRYLGESLPLLIGGFAMDLQGNGYVTGQILSNQNSDSPSSSGLFTTKNATWENSTKLRLYDVFVRKYSADNSTLMYSGIVGGNDLDWIGGYDLNIDGSVDNTGSAIAVDTDGNAYITGITQSFNFPRTLNVFGETFVSPPAATVFVSKISSDATRFVYSTSLNTNMSQYSGRIRPWFTGIGNFILAAPVLPAGIAVDFAGDAYITGNAHPTFVNFPDSPPGGKPGDPNEPTGYGFPTIPLQDPLDGTWDTPASPEYVTSEGWITVLNPTASGLLYSSYVGGRMEEQVFAPYVDRFGDVWVMGSIVTLRGYSRGNKNYGPTAGALPNALISPLAFKSLGDQDAEATINTIYGAYQSSLGFGAVQSAPFSVPMGYAMDGFVTKLRVGPPSVASITFNPGTVPGGFGAFSTATVTLSSPAPQGDAQIQIDLDSTTAASLDPTSPVGTIQVTIPAGQTSITFPIYTKPVTSNQGVLVKATYLGSFNIRQLNVVPWLQSLGVTPNNLVGGNTTSGRVTLAAKAPAGGISVDLTTDQPNVISFPGGNTVVVPAGQDSAIFTIKTAGVAKKTVASVTTSVGGVNRTSLLTLRTANLLNLTFSPTVIPGLGTTTGTLKLDGEAGSNFTVTLSGLPSSYKFPATLTFRAGETFKTFAVVVPAEAVQTDRVVTATRAASGGADGYLNSTVTGTFTVSVVTLKGITVSPNPVEGGANATGTVELTQPAPSGGVIVKISSPLASVTFDKNEIIIPEGASTGTFTIFTPVLQNDTVATIKAFRGSNVVSTKLTIKSASFGMTLSPSSVVGGNQNVTGTITLARAAGAGGLTVTLSSSDASVTVPASVTIPAGSTTATFTATTTSVTTNRDVTITGTLGSTVVTASFEVRAIGLLSVVFDSASVRGGSVAPVTITLDAPAPAGGLTLSLSESNSLFSNLPPTVQIPAGQTSIRLSSLLTKRVSRDQTTVLTVSTAGSQASAALKVTRAF